MSDVTFCYSLSSLNISLVVEPEHTTLRGSLFAHRCIHKVLHILIELSTNYIFLFHFFIYVPDRLKDLKWTTFVNFEKLNLQNHIQQGVASLERYRCSNGISVPHISYLWSKRKYLNTN